MHSDLADETARRESESESEGRGVWVGECLARHGEGDGEPHTGRPK